MAKKAKSLAQIMEEAQLLTKSLRTVKKAEERKSRGCNNHPGTIVYMKGLCKPCYEELTNTTLEAKLAKEPWVSTNGYKYVYDSDGNPTLYHRQVAENFLGRKLAEGERIMFLSNDKSDCSVENLGLQCIVPLIECN